MICRREPERSMWWGEVREIAVPDADFSAALAQAQAAAKSAVEGGEAMLIAWYDRTNGRFSPQVECCSEEMPGWMVYAKSRGGNLTVSVNDGAFLFIFLVERGQAP